MTQIARSGGGRIASLMIKQGLTNDLANVNLGEYLNKRKIDKQTRPYVESQLLKLLKKSINNYFGDQCDMIFNKKPCNKDQLKHLLTKMIEGYDIDTLKHIIHLCRIMRNSNSEKILKLFSSYL